MLCSLILIYIRSNSNITMRYEKSMGKSFPCWYTWKTRGTRLKPKGKNWKNGSQIWGSAILKELFSSYEEISSSEVIFIHNVPASFFNQRLKCDNFTIFSSDLLESRPPLTFRKSEIRQKSENSHARDQEYDYTSTFRYTMASIPNPSCGIKTRSPWKYLAYNLDSGSPYP